MSKEGGGGEKSSKKLTKKVGGKSSLGPSERRTQGGYYRGQDRNVPSSSTRLPASSPTVREITSTLSGTLNITPQPTRKPLSTTSYKSSSTTIAAFSGITTQSEQSHFSHHDIPSIDESIMEGVTTQTETESQRPMIAVSTLKGPAVFFNLARKFLVTYETCDLSALEGAIVAAIDAAHLLQRSKLATIIRIQTAYVAVEPRRRKQSSEESSTASTPATTGEVSQDVRKMPAVSITPSTTTHTDRKTSSVSSQGSRRIQSMASHQQHQKQSRRSKGKGPASKPVRELLRARITITVKRTEEYGKWLIDESRERQLKSGDSDDVFDFGGGGSGGPDSSAGVSLLPPTT